MTMADITALCAGGAILTATVIYLVRNQKQRILEWLKYAVTEAERMLGNGTGQLKLRAVYDGFCEQFPLTSAVLPFYVFAEWVDTALDTLDKWLETNADIMGYVGVIGKAHGGDGDGDIHC